MWRYSALLLVLFLAACERYPSGGDVRIRRDMVDQPSFRPQEDPRPLVEGTVPLTGIEPVLTRDQAMRDLVNPIPATPATIAQGAKLYRTSCVHCHGPKGRGDGPVAAKISRPADLAAQKYIESPDGLFYYTIRHGTPIMPALAEAIAPRERWEIVRYVRTLQRP
jgi:mono/diheme cytochrome c family protein